MIRTSDATGSNGALNAARPITMQVKLEMALVERI